MATKTFTYEAIDAAGALIKGKIESDSPDGAANSLANQRLIPLELSGLGTGLQEGTQASPGSAGGPR